MSYGAISVLVLFASFFMMLASFLPRDEGAQFLLLLSALVLAVTGGKEISNKEMADALKAACAENGRVMKEREFACSAPVEVSIKDGMAWDFKYPAPLPENAVTGK